jgi:Ran GTPase-activating protein (RanGAP) involved in mRNA processing and transport
MECPIFWYPPYTEIQIWRQFLERHQESISCVLSKSKTLKSLVIAATSCLGNKIAHGIAPALSTNSSLTSLYLNQNKIEEAGAIAIARALSINSCLTLLDLCWNEIGDEGAIAIAHALHFNSSLTSLVLYRNKIRGHGAIAIARALQINSSVT